MTPKKLRGDELFSENQNLPCIWKLFKILSNTVLPAYVDFDAVGPF